jgi:hypothetical protein
MRENAAQKMRGEWLLEHNFMFREAARNGSNNGMCIAENNILYQND